MSLPLVYAFQQTFVLSFLLLQALPPLILLRALLRHPSLLPQIEVIRPLKPPARLRSQSHQIARRVLTLILPKVPYKK